MLRYTLLIWLASVIGYDTNAQALLSNETDSISWNPKRKLVWQDFQGNPIPKNVNEVAGCAASIYIEGFWDNLLNFRVTNSFIKKDSWTLDTISLQLLEHEQLHFDIAEVYARKIRKAVDSLRKKEIKEVEAYSVVITILLKERNNINNFYDVETRHGTYGLLQKKWKTKIAKELKVLDKWRSLPKNE